jgi:pimeloyl-ACP methyl ester carboxylesterase
VSAPDPGRDHVTPYDRFAWSDTQIEQWLLEGVHTTELAAYFGADEHRALTRLARRAHRLPLAPDALKVVVVPGIMGSQLGLRRGAPLPDDVLWLDPIDIQQGRLALLRVGAGAPIVSLGAMLFSHLRLKLALRARGFAAELFGYDWRLSIGELGRDLAARLHAHERIALVAHSMGGLVARAALARPGTSHVARLVLLGTPNSGSAAAVQALRGTYAVVRKVARLAAQPSAEALVTEVFSTFPSLYDMLPTGSWSGRADLLDPEAWPHRGPRPRPELLAAARTTQGLLAPADARFAVIVGTGQVTVTAVARRRDDFIYTLTRHGDGSVAVASAALPGVRCVYARVAHSDLTRDPLVAAAVVDLLKTGRTTRLPQRAPGGGRAQAEVSDAELRRTHADKVDWGALSPEARRAFLENLNEPPQVRLRVTAPRARRRR